MSDILTMRVNILDKEKAKWIWDMMKMGSKRASWQSPEAPDLGVEVTAVSWGDTMNEDRYVLERVDRFLGGWSSREELLEEMGMEEDRTFDRTEQLEECIEIWKKEAREKYGPDVTVEDLKRRYEEKQKQRSFAELDPSSGGDRQVEATADARGVPES